MTLKRGGIHPYNLEIYKIMKEKYKNKKKGDKITYDLQSAIENEELVRKYYSKGLEQRLSSMLYYIEKLISRGYLPITDPGDDPEFYVRKIDYFGRTKGKRGFNNLCIEMRRLILKGEKLSSHSRRLQRDYHVGKAIIEGDKDNEFEGLWDWISKEFEGMTQEELKRLRKLLEEGHIFRKT